VKQRVGDKRRREVEKELGHPIRSMWHRGGRHPRYWEVFFEDHSVGRWYPETKHLEMTDMKWTEKP
jgi:hypothetical protein